MDPSPTQTFYTKQLTLPFELVLGMLRTQALADGQQGGSPGGRPPLLLSMGERTEASYALQRCDVAFPRATDAGRGIVRRIESREAEDIAGSVALELPRART